MSEDHTDVYEEQEDLFEASDETAEEIADAVIGAKEAETVEPKYGEPGFPKANRVAKGASRRALKKNGRHTFKKKYWTIVLICIFMAFFCGEFRGTLVLADSEDTSQVSYITEWGGDSVAQSMSDENDSLFYKYGLFGLLMETPAGQAMQQNVEVADRGVLAGIFKSVDSRGAIDSAVDTVVTVQGLANGTADLKDGVATFGGVLLSFLLFIFVWNIIIVGERRYFLENRTYSNIGPTRIAFVYGERATRHVAWIMFLMNLKYVLWCLTIVGGIVKYFEYGVIPFILAENPDIKTKDCFKLARKMMMGHKWEYFVFFLSFWYWDLLSGLTLGLVRIFFLNGYFRSAETEFYAAVRADAIARNIPYSELLCDADLYTPPEPDMETYPGTVRKHVKAPIHVNYNRKYTIINILLLFFIFSVVGWLWEVGLHLAQDHEFVNRGTLFGPWLPIYGCGGLFILLALQKFRGHPMLHFVLAAVLCGALEYFTSWYLEMSKGALWWDYTGYLLNLNGRICLEGLLAFAIGGTLFVYLLAPLIDNLLLKIPKKVRIGAIVVLAALFCTDLVYSHYHPNMGHGITDYGQDAETTAALPEGDGDGHAATGASAPEPEPEPAAAAEAA